MSEQFSEIKYLDMPKLSETFMNNMDIIKQVLSSFKGSFEAFEAEYLSATKAGDTEQMSRLAHGLKGSAGNIRSEVLSLKAAELQKKIESGDEVGVLAGEVISDLTALLKEIELVTEG